MTTHPEPIRSTCYFGVTVTLERVTTDPTRGRDVWHVHLDRHLDADSVADALGLSNSNEYALRQVQRDEETGLRAELHTVRGEF